MEIPDINNLIDALNCTEWVHYGACEHCPYNYQIYDTSGDSYFWRCNDDKLWEHVLFYLKLYQYLINNNKNNKEYKNEY